MSLHENPVHRTVVADDPAVDNSLHAADQGADVDGGGLWDSVTLPVTSFGESNRGRSRAA
jgi:hypothetical protein